MLLIAQCQRHEHIPQAPLLVRRACGRALEVPVQLGSFRARHVRACRAIEEGKLSVDARSAEGRRVMQRPPIQRVPFASERTL